ncbi:diaminobutyrate acetyltransferase [Pusillimonas sp. CC-YST705]|uniref:L-2,4-diaminobutyric acid acetyltransferase n=1 Tax=Mesopusillimonas faecipullorum TaxID=2755040 RepID=A0ABS8CA46_9BURK|nr:diaminobutyrate acetyltransferase [Mesopusillimonas faecipullorum]MCB5362863.1 diaminobutyrate acetyltransferase [Mesopusillimonas faecipullorum]
MKQIPSEISSISQSWATSAPTVSEVATLPLELRPPAIEDGPAIHQLISRCPPLDLNSAYAYLLWCQHFQGTSVVAVGSHGVEGFVSAYVPPEKDDTLFIWQVAVDARRRGQGLGLRMLLSLFERDPLKKLKFVEATVGPGNKASRAMFSALAKRLDVALNESPLFAASLFGEGHEEECLLRLGPRPFVPKRVRPFCDLEP